jgi:hypothetical protein
VIKQTAFVAAAAMLVLAGCSQGATPAENTQSAKSNFKLPDTCKDHYLLAALPAPADLGGKSLTSVECQPFSVEMVWGDEMSPTKIILVDSQGPNGDLPAGLADMGRKLPMDASRTAITMTKGVQEAALAYPASLAELGGEDYLSIVKEAGGGLVYALPVEPKDSGGEVGALIGIVKDRYSLTIGIEDGNIIGIAAGEAAYAPWLSALRLSALQ